MVSVSQIFKRIVFAISIVIFVDSRPGLRIWASSGGSACMPATNRMAHTSQMRVYAEVLRKIQNYYVTDPNITRCTNGALHGLLDSLDPDSSYLTPAEYKMYKDRPAHDNGQTGLTISKRFGYATIVNVLPGSPADQEHLRDGDVIDLIEGQSTHELPLALVRFMLTASREPRSPSRWCGLSSRTPTRSR